MDTYLTVEEVADILRVKRQTAREIIKTEIPYLIIGKRIRVKESDLFEYIDINTERRHVDGNV